MGVNYIGPAAAAVQNIGPAAADQRVTPSKLLFCQPPDQPVLFLLPCLNHQATWTRGGIIQLFHDPILSDQFHLWPDMV